MTLDEVRREIDSIDNQLIDLLVRRMTCSEEVAAIKQREHLPVLNTAREEEILRQVGEKGGEFGGALQTIFSNVMSVSRALQHKQLQTGETLRSVILNASRESPARPCRVVCQGVEGAYSSRAARRVFPGCTPVFTTHFEDVFRLIESNGADFGILPVENSSAGSVSDVYDLLLKYRFSVVGGVNVKISHCLAAAPGTRFAQIRTVYSHPQGIRQCSEYLEKNHLPTQIYSNTAAAAEMVAGSREPLAAICSREAAERCGLNILAESIQNSGDNCTRFIVIAKDIRIPADADKISLCFSLPHVTGSLYSTLARFAILGLNLTKIESRPIPGRNFEYFFYLDFTGNVLQNPEVLDLVCALSEELPDFSFLGNYKELGV